ncbi:MAG: hypothetical protein PVJ50_05220 [Desulfobacterales bacterium]
MKMWNYLSKIRKIGVQVLIGVYSHMTIISLSIDPAKNDEMVNKNRLPEIEDRLVTKHTPFSDL